MAATVRNARTKAIRKRTRILGTSKKKLLRSTSFFVAPHSAERVGLGRGLIWGAEELTNVVTEHVGEEGLVEVNGETTEEYHA
jgi:hypothetical protein